MGVVGGKKVLLQRNSDGQVKPVVEDKSTTVIQQAGGNNSLGKLDSEAIKGLIKTMPTAKQEATAAADSQTRIDKMLTLLEGGAGGKAGQLSAVLAPYAEATGLKSKFLSDAKLYETLAKTIGGSMRVAIVGPGPVSNYENQ